MEKQTSEMNYAVLLEKYYGYKTKDLLKVIDDNRLLIKIGCRVNDVLRVHYERLEAIK
nr:MAG TPA: hypothetical protein [Caudoviricetes sp.]